MPQAQTLNKRGTAAHPYLPLDINNTPTRVEGPDAVYNDQNLYECVVVGAGIAGVAAAAECKKLGMGKVLVLEKNNYVGGHEITVDGKVDIGFLFGHFKEYSQLLSTVKELGLNIVKQPLYLKAPPFYDNNDVNTPWIAEIDRMCELAKSPPLYWWFLSFEEWCDIHEFTGPFREQVVDPLLSLLFVTHNGAWAKPAPVILQMIARPEGEDGWLSISPRLKHPELWAVEGGNQRIAEGIASKYGLNIVTEQVLQTVEPAANAAGAGPAGSVWAVRTQNATYWTKNVLFACHPHEFGHAMRWRPDQERLIRFCQMSSSFATGHLHSRIPYPFRRQAGSYVYSVPDQTLTLQMPEKVVDYDFTLCLGSENNKMPYPDPNLNVFSKRASRSFRWVHPEQDTFYLVKAIFNWIGPWQEQGGIHFAGGWSTILSHEHAFRSGRDAAWRMRNPTLARLALQINLLWQCPAYVVVVVGRFGARWIAWVILMLRRLFGTASPPAQPSAKITAAL